MTTVPLARADFSVMSNWISDLAVDRQVQVADVEDAGAVGAARAAGAADVGAGRDATSVSVPGTKAGGVERIQLVEDPEIAERLIGGPEAQRVAQRVAGRGRRRGIRAARQIRDGLLEEDSREAPPSRCGRPRGPGRRACRWSACAL